MRPVGKTRAASTEEKEKNNIPAGHDLSEMQIHTPADTNKHKKNDTTLILFLFLWLLFFQSQIHDLKL